MKPIFKLKTAGILALFAALMLWMPQRAFAQNLTITGKVLDEFNLPLPGALVIGVGSGKQTTTKDDGTYSITVPTGTRQLEVSFLGMTTQFVNIDGKSVVNIVLVSEAISLTETVVIGYGSQKKADVTSAVASVKSENFIKATVQDAAQLIQGKVAGLNISLSSGDPTAGSQVLLRGNTSIYGTNSPLVLVDGIVGSLNTVAPEDVESIDVLKDASAAAIYGTRGAAGVIIVTTKKSRNEIRPTAEYSGNLSVRTWEKKADFMNAAQLRARWASAWVAPNAGANDQDYGATTDWLDEISRTGISQVHNLTFRGGSRNTNYVASINYRDMQGTFIKSDNNRVTGRADINHGMFDGILKLNFSTIVTEQWNYSGPMAYAYRQALIRNPTEPVRNDNDTWYERGVYFYSNPVAYIEETDALYRQRSSRLTGGITLTPIHDLNLKMMYTRKSNSSQSGSYQTHNHYSNTSYGGNHNGVASRRTSDNYSDIFELTGDYRFDIAQKHHFTAMAGYSYEYNFYSGFAAGNEDFPTDAYGFWNIGAGKGLKEGIGTMSSTASMDKLIALFARVTYNFNDKYLLMASIRHEGSSKFGEDHKWGNFPGISAGWRLDNEEFMKSIKWIDLLKLRVGYGVTGVNAGEAYASLARLMYDTGTYFYDNGQWIAPLMPASNANPSLGWETKKEFNIGLDATLWGGRLGATIDIYTNKSKDGLWNYSVPSPPYLYGSILANVLEMENKGFEVALNTVPIRTKSLEWRADFTYSTNANKVLKIQSDQFQMENDYIDQSHTGEPIQQYTQRIMIGQPYGTFWGLKSVDVSNDGKWLIQGSDGTQKLLVDATDDDKMILGNGVPKHLLSWNNTIYFKGFDLNVNMRGAFGFQILNFQRMFYENPNIQYNVLNSAFDKVYGKAVLTEVSQEYVSYYVEKGDYLKIDNITLGYTFDLAKTKILQNMRVYVSGLNLLTITSYKGIDPEVQITYQNAMGPGVDQRDKYPTIKTFTFGVNITF